MVDMIEKFKLSLREIKREIAEPVPNEVRDLTPRNDKVPFSTTAVSSFVLGFAQGTLIGIPLGVLARMAPKNIQRTITTAGFILLGAQALYLGYRGLIKNDLTTNSAAYAFGSMTGGIFGAKLGFGFRLRSWVGLEPRIVSASSWRPCVPSPQAGGSVQTVGNTLRVNTLRVSTLRVPRMQPIAIAGLPMTVYGVMLSALSSPTIIPGYLPLPILIEPREFQAPFWGWNALRAVAEGLRPLAEGEEDPSSTNPTNGTPPVEGEEEDAEEMDMDEAEAICDANRSDPDFETAMDRYFYLFPDGLHERNLHALEEDAPLRAQDFVEFLMGRGVEFQEDGKVDPASLTKALDDVGEELKKVWGQDAPRKEKELQELAREVLLNRAIRKGRLLPPKEQATDLDVKAFLRENRPNGEDLAEARRLLRERYPETTLKPDEITHILQIREILEILAGL